MMITRYAPGGAVAAASHLAASAGLAMLRRGGNAVDAAIATAAVMAVTSPHMCGLGGDLFALVAERDRDPVALNASGRAGSGAEPGRLRAEGAREMPFVRDIRSVTVPGCVDGLVMLAERFASLSLADLLAPARRLAREGFPVSATLAEASTELAPDERALAFGAPEPLVRGRRLVLAGIGEALSDIGTHGRAGFYQGSSGDNLLALGGGEFTADDLRARHADWVQPLQLPAFGRRLWTAPPNSQGYLALAGAWIAEQAGLPDDPGDERWAFTLVEAARQAAFDRPSVLHEHADGAGLLAAGRLAPRAAAVREQASRGLADVYGDGGTTHICAVDRDRTGVSLIMSNAADFGSRLVLPGQGIVLHNRGMGFSLRPGHPTEYGPGRRPPHTLTPLVITGPDGVLDTVAGTMGGDAQPQVLLQLLARMFARGQDPGEAIAAPRWVLSRDPTTYFDIWQLEDPPLVRLEHDAPRSWATGLRARGYEVVDSPPGDQAFGHAQVISLTRDGMLAGAADPRSGDGAFTGW
ncbi:MAG: gamma-glutamyltransferase [Streptosporangiaceae bacterium]|nr:gamma-glutamyltransferase [Streptosporangiaceae bacterium]